MKTITTLSILILTSLAFATEVPKSLYCNPRSEGEKPAYETTSNPFLDSAVMVRKDLKPAFDLYNKNFPSLKSYMAEECKTAKDANALIYRASEYCFKKCDDNAAAYVSAMFDKKGQQEQIANDCKEICHKHWWEASNFNEGYRARMNQESDQCARNPKASDTAGNKNPADSKTEKAQNR